MRYVYEEPVRGGYPPIEFLGLAGIDRMRMGAEGRMPPPPNAHLIGLRPIDSGYGTSTFSMPLSPWLRASGGFYLGGVAALVADAPLGGAILSTVGPGVFGVTSELSMNYLRPALPESTLLVARARQINVGRSLGLSEATVEDSSGRVLAHLTSRYFLRALDPIPVPHMPEVQPRVDYGSPDPYERPLDDEVSDDPKWIEGSGLETFRAIIDGTAPPAPFAKLFGIRTLSVDEGEIACSIVASPWLTSPARTIYGGTIAFLADCVLTGAVTTTLPAGSSAAPLDVKVQYLRPGIADGRDLIARGEVMHRGNSLAIARAEIINADGKQIALATGSSMILDGRPWSTISVVDEIADDE